MRKLLKLPTFKARISAAMLATVILALEGGVTNAAAQVTESVAYNFAGGTGDGAEPFAGLAIDSSNNLYGATLYGGLYGAGVVFELQSGAISDMVLCNMPGDDDPNSTPGATPWGTPVLSPTPGSGAIYGTAPYDSYNDGTLAGNGVVYACTPKTSGGGYSYSVLRHFAGGTSDGANPFAGVSIDTGGSNLYGTTVFGGASGDGTIYKLPASGGTTEPPLYSFTGASNNGAEAYGGVILDTTGTKLWGTTVGGGTSFEGTIYEEPIAGGTPTFWLNFASNSSYGFEARAGLARDNTGGLYGTTMLGGTGGGTGTNGVAFTYFPIGSGFYTVLHPFTGAPDGSQPWSGLYWQASTGNLYGTTQSGGSSGYGTVFELEKTSTGYTYLSLYSFAGGTSDGANPYSAVVMDSTGTYLYGTTANGGMKGHGVIFKISLPAALTHRQKQKH